MAFKTINRILSIGWFWKFTVLQCTSVSHRRSPSLFLIVYVALATIIGTNRIFICWSKHNNSLKDLVPEDFSRLPFTLKTRGRRLIMTMFAKLAYLDPPFKIAGTFYVLFIRSENLVYRSLAWTPDELIWRSNMNVSIRHVALVAITAALNWYPNI